MKIQLKRQKTIRIWPKISIKLSKEKEKEISTFKIIKK